MMAGTRTVPGPAPAGLVQAPREGRVSELQCWPTVGVFITVGSRVRECMAYTSGEGMMGVTEQSCGIA